MREALALIAAVDQVAGAAAVRDREFGRAAYSLRGNDLLWVAASCPRHLVLDLGVADRFTGQLIMVIAAARQQLPVGCLLESRPASPAVRKLLEFARWPGVRVIAARQEAEPAGCMATASLMSAGSGGYGMASRREKARAMLGQRGPQHCDRPGTSGAHALRGFRYRDLTSAEVRYRHARA